MSKIDNLGDFLTDLADAIRSKTGKTGVINAQDMAYNIKNINTNETFKKLTDGSLTWIKEDDFKEASTLFVVGDYAFYRSNLVTVTLPNTVYDLKTQAFAYNSKLSIFTLLSSGAIQIGEGCFLGCTNLERFDTVNGLGTVLNDGFRRCIKLKSVKFISESTCSIGAYAFCECEGLTDVEIDINSGLQSIDSNAFEGCNSLTNITFNNKLGWLNSRVFKNCTSLTTVKFTNPTAPTIIDRDYLFEGCTALEKIEVPNSSIESYKTALGNNWSGLVVGY